MVLRYVSPSQRLSTISPQKHPKKSLREYSKPYISPFEIFDFLRSSDGLLLTPAPTGPTAFSNGPSCVEVQADWIIDAIKKLKQEHIAFINPTKDAEEKWRQNVTDISNKTLFPGTSSWYMGANVPGKPREQLNYAGGLPLYQQECRDSLDGWKGFEVKTHA